MCGRLVRSSDREVIAEEFDAAEVDFALRASFNVAPSQYSAIIINGGSRRLVECRWGFLPSWAKDPKSGYKMINARAETAATSPAYRKAFASQRCIVPADGFYEWKKTGKSKTPMYIRLASTRMMAMAGLYSFWRGPGGEGVCTFTIITVPSNELIAPIHDRMPLILPRADIDKWLDPATTDKDMLAGLLKPYPSEELSAYEVSTIVNSPSNDTPECIRPVA